MSGQGVAAGTAPGEATRPRGAPASDRRSSDVIVIGAGVAGLTAALGLAATRRVFLITKTALGSGGSSPMAQGGVAAAVGVDDTPGLHAQDTLAAAAGLGDPAMVDLLTRGGPVAIRRLIKRGARFDRAADGRLDLGREAAHSRRRILHAHGDATGAEIIRALAEAVHHAPGITVWEHAFAWDLAVEGGSVVGVDVVNEEDSDDRMVRLRAPAVILATGGCGRLFSHTTNPPEVTADGLAMAARAGARLADLEFVQFHPTALATGADPMPLVTEALRGEGAVLVDEAGRRFMRSVHPQAELAPRDVVARAIWRELEAGRVVYLDARAAVGDAFPDRFPTVYALCRRHGVDPRREPIPVAPAAHYHMGGIAVDVWGRASLPGLWACGEAASTGVHGANRLASNSLLEGLVFGARVAEAALAPPTPLSRAFRERGEPGADGRPPALVIHAGHSSSHTISTAYPFPPTTHMGHPSPLATNRAWLPPLPRLSGEGGRGGEGGLRHLMWHRVGLVRDAAGLREALAEIDRLEQDLGAASTASAPDRALGEARNLILSGRLVAAAALARCESRGAHYRADHPEPDPRWGRRLFVVLRGAAPDITLDEVAPPPLASGADVGETVTPGSTKSATVAPELLP